MTFSQLFSALLVCIPVNERKEHTRTIYPPPHIQLAQGSGLSNPLSTSPGHGLCAWGQGRGGDSRKTCPRGQVHGEEPQAPPVKDVDVTLGGQEVEVCGVHPGWTAQLCPRSAAACSDPTLSTRSTFRCTDPRTPVASQLPCTHQRSLTMQTPRPTPQMPWSG